MWPQKSPNPWSASSRGPGEELLAEPVLLPRQEAGVAQDGVGQLGHLGHADAAAVDERPLAPRRPPPPVQRRRRHHPDLDPALWARGGEGPPHREAAQVVLGAVDRWGGPPPTAARARGGGPGRPAAAAPRPRPGGPPAGAAPRPRPGPGRGPGPGGPRGARRPRAGGGRRGGGPGRAPPTRAAARRARRGGPGPAPGGGPGAGRRPGGGPRPRPALVRRRPAATAPVRASTTPAFCPPTAPAATGPGRTVATGYSDPSTPTTARLPVIAA